jgi:hypothetical protein
MHHIFSQQKSLWSSEMNVHHVPLRQSAEGKVRGKGREGVSCGESRWSDEVGWRTECHREVEGNENPHDRVFSYDQTDGPLKILRLAKQAARRNENWWNSWELLIVLWPGIFPRIPVQSTPHAPYSALTLLWGTWVVLTLVAVRKRSAASASYSTAQTCAFFAPEWEVDLLI